MNNLTVLIPTSPIPSHPSTAILDETIANIRKYTDARIIIMFDGIHQSLESRREQYKEYYDNVVSKSKSYGDVQLVKFPSHLHQSGMTKYVLSNLVKTPLVMFCEHDTSPIGNIPFDDLCLLIENHDTINCIRFNIFDSIPNEHQYLMLNKEPSTARYWVHGGIDIQIKIVRTIQWSQRPHIAKTKWYLDILRSYFTNESKCMIEDIMHGRVQVDYENNLKKDFYGLAIYTPDGNQLRSYHSDGRGSDEKIIYG